MDMTSCSKGIRGPRRVRMIHKSLVGLFCCTIFLAAAQVGLATDCPVQSVVDNCADQKQQCIQKGDQAMSDCLDTGEDLAEQKCADLSDAPTPTYYVAGPGANPAPVYNGPSERQQCENALTKGTGSYTTSTGYSISISTSGAASVSMSQSSTYTGLGGGYYAQCQMMHGDSGGRELKCGTDEKQCLRDNCSDAHGGPDAGSGSGSGSGPGSGH
jgi:hypothetical protein